jgi:histidinol dehydrogenase
MSPVSFHDLSASPDASGPLRTRSTVDLESYCQRAQPIIDAVRSDGDTALLRFAREFDGVETAAMSLCATQAEFAAAESRVPADVIESMERAIDNIRRYHEAQRPGELWLKEIVPGAWAGDRHTPLDSVACYVPRGKGSFPSVACMTAIPAVVAGVPRPVIITPPGADGTVDPATLVAARMIGIAEVYKCGGAQGVAAVAYGTQTVPRCLKIVGPGSPWVVAAKRLLAHVIDPGIPAGPSEALILADATANPAVAALDLLIEAEHGPDSSVFLVTHSRQVADAVVAALPAHWESMDRRRVEFSRAVLCGAAGGIVLTRDLAASIEFVNDYAPEHLELLCAEPLAVLGRIRNAGEVLLGPYTPISLGNFVLGPNAVLPTAGHARTRSALSVFDFLKRTSVGYVTQSGYDALAVDAGRLAAYEGFDAHARAVSPLRRQLLGDHGDHGGEE